MAAHPAHPSGLPAEDGWVRSARMWSRVVQPLPDDPVLHACALAYISDFGSGFADLSIPGLPRAGPASIHSLWFRDPVRADDWVLRGNVAAHGGGARGMYAGSMRDASGTAGGHAHPGDADTAGVHSSPCGPVDRTP